MLSYNVERHLKHDTMLLHFVADEDAVGGISNVTRTNSLTLNYIDVNHCRDTHR